MATLRTHLGRRRIATVTPQKNVTGLAPAAGMDIATLAMRVGAPGLAGIRRAILHGWNTSRIGNRSTLDALTGLLHHPEDRKGRDRCPATRIPASESARTVRSGI
jgi:hypothetical protein